MLERNVVCVYDMHGRHDSTFTSIVCVNGYSITIKKHNQLEIFWGDD